MRKLAKLLSFFLFSVPCFSNLSTEYIPPEVSASTILDRTSHPYFNFAGSSSFTLGVEAGVMQQIGMNGFDVRLGAGTILFASGALAHINYLRYMSEGSEAIYLGAGAGISYSYEFRFDYTKETLAFGPNLVIGRKFRSEGKQRLVDLNLLFPINFREAGWCVPTVSTGWMF